MANDKTLQKFDYLEWDSSYNSVKGLLLYEYYELQKLHLTHTRARIFETRYLSLRHKPIMDITMKLYSKQKSAEEILIRLSLMKNYMQRIKSGEMKFIWKIKGSINIEELNI